jgi:hypothetical protein
MATALRPRASASMMISRYGSQVLALGARPGRGGAASVDTPASEMAGFAGPVDTSVEMAGFGFDSLRRPRPPTAMPAAFR